MGLMRRKSVRVITAVLAVVVLAVVGIKVFLPAEKIRDLALEQARTKLGRDVSVGEVAVSLKGGLGVRLGDFAIHNPEGFAGERLLTTRGLDLKLALRPLLKREIRVSRLVVDSPELNLMVRSDGSNNFTFAAGDSIGQRPSSASSKGGKKATPPLSVASLTVNDGLLRFSDGRAAASAVQAIEVTGLDLGLSLMDPAPEQFQSEGRVSAKKIVVTGAQAVPELNADLDFAVLWDMATSQLTITKAEARVMDLPLTATGQVGFADGSATGLVNFKATDLAIVDLSAFAPPEIAAKMKGTRDSGTLSAKVDLHLTGNTVSPVRSTGVVTARNIDLSLAQPFMPPRQTGKLSGRGDLDLSFTQEGTAPEQLTYTGTATVKGVSYKQSGMVDELQHLDGVIKFTPKEFTATSCQGRFASGTFDLQGTLRDPFPYFLPPEMQGEAVMKKPHLRFTLHSARLDVDRLLPAASPTGSKTKARPRPVASSPKMEFPDLTCEGTFQADSLIYMQVPFTGVQGQVKVRDRVLHCENVTGAVYQGRVNGRVDIDLKDMNSPLYSGDYQAKSIEVNEFVSRFAGLKEVLFGGCDLGGSFSARGLDPEIIRNSLSLDADAGVKQGKLVTTGNVYQALNKLSAQAGQTLNSEQALRDLATHIKVENGRVGVDNLTVRLGQVGEVTVGGYYAFNGDVNYSGSILLTKDQTDRLFASGVMAELGKLLGSKRPERLAIPLSVGGTRTDPKVKLDLGSVAQELQKSVVKEQGKKLEDEAKTKLNDLIKKWK